MSRISFFLCLIVLLSISFNSAAQVKQRAKFSAKEVREDFEYLYKTLEQSHYNLYVNTKKEVFEKGYQKIYNSISDSLTLLEVTRLFQPFVALSKLAHCNIGFPFSLYFDKFNQDTSKVFPFSVAMINHHALITDNYSNNGSVERGDEILSIDGTAIDIKFQEMYDFLSGEGNEVKNTLIDLFSFPRIYWWRYDSRDEFIVTVKSKAGGIKSVVISGIKATDFEKRISKSKPVFNLNREFKMMRNTAYLHTGIFINNESTGNTSEQATFETGEFISFIDSCFRVIHKAKSKNLIIDLRGNPGGDNSFSDPMIAYFATKPFKFCSEFSVKTSRITKEFWKDVKDSALRDLKNQILSKQDGEVFEANIPYFFPRTDSFYYKGNVYVLVDRYSYSNAVSVAAIIQDYQFGKVFGEPTSDVASSYGATHEFKLPNSQVSISYPKAFIVRPSADRTLKGVTPDIEIRDDVFTDSDEILDFTIKYINDRK